MENKPTWHVVHTKPRQERLARNNLEYQGFKVYLPELQQSTPTHGATAPLFPRYLFIRLTAGRDNWAPIRSTRGVSSLVRVGLNPATISDQLIDAIRQRENADGLHTIPAKPLNRGDRIRLVSGPFADYEAIFSEQRAENRAIILLNLIGKQSRVEVPAESIARL